MKTVLLAISFFLFPLSTFAAGTKFKNLREAYAFYNYHVTCSSRSGSPQVHATFSSGKARS